MNVKQVLRIIRIKRDMTQTDVAEKLGISKSALSAIEVGKKPITSQKFHELSFVLNLTSEEKIELAKAIMDSKESFRIDTNSEENKEIGVWILTRYSGMSKADKRKILEYLKSF